VNRLVGFPRRETRRDSGESQEETPHHRCGSPGERGGNKQEPSLVVAMETTNASPILRGLAGTGNVFSLEKRMRQRGVWPVGCGDDSDKLFHHALATPNMKRDCLLDLLERESI